MFNNMNMKIRIIAGFYLATIVAILLGIVAGAKLSGFALVGIVVGAIVIAQVFGLIITASVKAILKNKLSSLKEELKSLEKIAKDLTSSSMKLAEGSKEQAASIEKTSSTLEEASSMLHKTTENTQQADILAQKAKESADKGAVEMKVMLDAVKELKSSSDEIAKIIKVIDEIAFQTNILSLNAAVEAARAGDAGKGFAVVAEEVRNLAQRSAEAAKDTAGIIEDNINLSDKCMGITNRINDVLQEINTESNKVTELLAEISTASAEQEIGINNISKAISQMEVVMKSSAGAADEVANYAKGLVDSSKKLDNTVIEVQDIATISNSDVDAVKFSFQKATSEPIKSSVPSKGNSQFSKFVLEDKKTAAKQISSTKAPVEKLEAKKEPVALKAKEIEPQKLEAAAEPQKLEAKVQPVTPEQTTSKVKPEDIIPLDDF